MTGPDASARPPLTVIGGEDALVCADGLCIVPHEDEDRPGD